MKGARRGMLWRKERRINADNAWLLERLRRSWAGLAAYKTVENSHLISLPNCFSSAALDRTQHAAASSEHSRAHTRSGSQPPREREMMMMQPLVCAPVNELLRSMGTLLLAHEE